MKNTHDPFDNELRERLLNYTEEPDKDLWNGIARNIDSVNVEPDWVIWSTRLSVVVVVSVIFLFYPNEDVSYETASADQVVHAGSAISITGTPAPHQPADIPVTDETRPSHSEITISRLAFVASEQHQLICLPFEVPTEVEDISIVFNTTPALSTPESVIIISGQSPSGTTPLSKNKSDNARSVSDSIEKKKSGKLNKKLRKHKPFSFYLTAMPTFGYQRIASNKKDNIFIEGIKHVPAFSVDRLSVRIEAGTEVPISKRWTAFGGVLYYQRKQTIAYTERIVDTLIFDSRPGGGIIVEPELNYSSKSTEYELKNVGLQAGISYQLWVKNEKRMKTREAMSSENLLFPKRKFLHVLGSGIEFHKPLNRTRSFQRAEGFSDPSMYVFFNLYYRLQYPNTGRLRAIFQPTLNYSFYINEDLNAPFYVKPYGLGVNFGCTYNFR